MGIRNAAITSVKIQGGSDAALTPPYNGLPRILNASSSQMRDQRNQEQYQEDDK